MRTILVAVGLAVVVGLTLLLLRPADSGIRPPERTGHCWAATLGNANCVAYVTAEERGRVRALSPGRNTAYATDHYMRYRLAVRRLPGGELVSEVLLGDVLRADNRPAPQIVGVVGDVLWLWHVELEARSVADLALRCDAAALRSRRPADAELFPRAPQQFKVLAAPPCLLMRGRDAKFYRIEPEDFALHPFPATELPRLGGSNQPETWFDFIRTAAEGRTMTSPFNQMTQVVLAAPGTWLGLMSESELADLPTWVADDSRPSGDVARSLYRTTYTRDDRYANIDPKAAQRMGDGTFVQGGFVRRHGREPWLLRDPDSALVLSRRRLGADEPWQLSRLGFDGALSWTTDTGLVDPGEFLDAGPFLVAMGTPTAADTTVRASQSEVMVWIDARTGAKGALRFQTGELLR